MNTPASINVQPLQQVTQACDAFRTCDFTVIFDGILILEKSIVSNQWSISYEYFILAGYESSFSVQLFSSNNPGNFFGLLNRSSKFLRTF